MTVFERILHIDEPTFNRLLALGVLRPNARRNLLIYEYYLAEAIKYGSMQAITNAAMRFCLSDKSIEKIIQRFK